MKVAIRVDASVRIGFGHLMRCRTLALELAARGAEVFFLCREHKGHGIDLLRADGFTVYPLSAPDTEPASDTDYAGWLGVSVLADAADTAKFLPGPMDWVVVDHYGLDAQWESALRPLADRVLVIDDLANRPHDCDLLLDQNYAGPAKDRYDGRVPGECTQLLGPEFALLHPAFREQRLAAKNRIASGSRVERVFVFFGGTDPDDLTGRTLEALRHPSLAHLEVDLVVGANYPHRTTLKQQVAHHGRATLHDPRPHLADLMAAADLALGAGGATTWERCCLGLPSLVVSVAENQRPACEALAADGIIDYLGTAREVTADLLGSHLLALVHDPSPLAVMPAAGHRLVDGKGSGRVVEALHQHSLAVS